jgi:orotidine-5'-phosphate decarboxylase
MGVSMLTLHAAGGPRMLDAAIEAAATVPGCPALLAVTVLTSMDAEQLAATGVYQPPAAQVANLAQMAFASGIRGFVASAQEVVDLRYKLGDQAVLVIPGIRPAGSAIGDQKRVATPSAAIADGASYLVVGRPITQAADPRSVAKEILREMDSTLSPN